MNPIKTEWRQVNEPGSSTTASPQGGRIGHIYPANGRWRWQVAVGTAHMGRDGRQFFTPIMPMAQGEVNTEAEAKTAAARALDACWG